jgi:hypothetical protein
MAAEKENLEASEEDSLIAKGLGSKGTLPKSEECPIGDTSGRFSFGKISVQAPRLLHYREIRECSCPQQAPIKLTNHIQLLGNGKNGAFGLVGQRVSLMATKRQ